MDKLISIQEASKRLGVTVKTLKIWDVENKLKPKMRTIGGHRRYNLREIEFFINNSGNQNNPDKNVFVYCRVSTKKQQDSGNLERQKERIEKYCAEKGYKVVDTFQEVASGLNDNRRELTKMFQKINEVDKVIVEYNDRLARFGFNYLKEFCKFLGVEIEAIEQKVKLEPNEEMVNDLISIVTCFSARLYGARGGRKIKETLLELEKERSLAVENNNESNIN